MPNYLRSFPLFDYRWWNPLNNEFLQGLILVAIPLGAWFLSPVFAWGILIGMFWLGGYVVLLSKGVVK